MGINTMKALLIASITGVSLWIAVLSSAQPATPPKSSKIAKPSAASDVADIPAKDIIIGKDKNKRYFLIGPKSSSFSPKNGHKLVIVMPGGSGDEKFHSFVKRIYKKALGNDYLVAQLVAFKWHKSQSTVWPTKTNPVKGQKFSTEEFVEAVVADVKSRYRIDGKYIFTFSWSSSGPAAYAISLQKNSPITGSYVAMSVFRTKWLPALDTANGHPYFLDHSREDKVCPYSHAQQAEQLLTKAGAKVKLNTYKGGHGWRGNIYGRIKRGIKWLEKQQTIPQ
jgi:predicted esterase